MMENEILSTAFADLFADFGERKKDLKLIGEMVKRDKRAVERIAQKLPQGSDIELTDVRDMMRRDKRAVDLLTGILGASSGGTVSKNSTL